jgi:hypothetical protein
MEKENKAKERIDEGSIPPQSGDPRVHFVKSDQKNSQAGGIIEDLNPAINMIDARAKLLREEEENEESVRQQTWELKKRMSKEIIGVLDAMEDTFDLWDLQDSRLRWGPDHNTRFTYRR